MNRCFSLSLSLSVLSRLHPKAAALALVACAAVPWAAQAQIIARQFPPAAQRGAMVVVQPPVITLNGKAERLSPGARIKGANNLVVLSGSLVGQSLLVNYVRDPLGLVHEVWILTEAEAAEKRPGMASSNIVWGSDANAPAVDDGKTPFNRLPVYKP